jgi:Arc/MetJ family transcription regulator
MLMTRTMIDLNDEKLAEAAQILGTHTKVDTVNRALAEVVNRRKQLEFIDDLAAGDIDLSEENMSGAWR